MGSSYSIPTAFADGPSSDDTLKNAPFTPFTSRFSPSPASSTESASSDKPSSDKPSSDSDATTKTADATSDVNTDAKSDAKTDAKSDSNTESSSLWGGHRADVANPGTFEEASQEATLILRPNLIEGLSFNFNAPLSESFALGTALDMGAKTRPPVFALNANYFTNSLVMLSRTTPSEGRVNARIFVNHSPALVSKIVADVSPDPDSSRLSYDLDYRAARSSSQLKAASGRVLAINHLHAVTPKLSLGAEIFCQTRSGLAALTLAAKYQDAHRIASISAASFGPIVASYVRKVNPKVSFATEMFVDTNSNESHVTMGYRFDLSSATVIGNVDSSGKVSATLEERVNPAFSLTLSGELDHAKENHNFGFGVTIGGG